MQTIVRIVMCFPDLQWQMQGRSLHIAPTQRLHHACNAAGFRRCREQMYMVGHEHVGVDDAADVECDFPQPVAIARVIGLGKEAGSRSFPRWTMCCGTSGKSRRARLGMVLVGMTSREASLAVDQRLVCQQSPARAVGKCTLTPVSYNRRAGAYSGSIEPGRARAAGRNGEDGSRRRSIRRLEC